jgi:hypothetical protein
MKRRALTVAENFAQEKGVAREERSETMVCSYFCGFPQSLQYKSPMLEQVKREASDPTGS